MGNMFHISSVHTVSCYSSKHMSGLVFLKCAVTTLSIRRKLLALVMGWHWPPFGCGCISRHRLGVVLYADVGVLLINREGNRMWQGEGEWEARNRANRSSLLTAAGLAGADGGRERGTQVWHWSDGTGPAGFDLRKEDEHVWTTDESTKLSEAAGSLLEKKKKKKVNSWCCCTLTYVLVLLWLLSQQTVHCPFADAYTVDTRNTTSFSQSGKLYTVYNLK